MTDRTGFSYEHRDELIGEIFEIIEKKHGLVLTVEEEDTIIEALENALEPYFPEGWTNYN